MSRRRLLRTAVRGALSPPAPPPFSEEDLRTEAPGRDLHPGFLLGAATAAHQVEGGNDNDWTDWERGRFPDGRPHIAGGSACGAACDSWNRFDEDLRLLGELGANAYRFSVEWSRLEPSEGQWNDSAAQRYRSWISKLRAAGIRSMVTLYHFTLPRWVAADGGWTNPRTVDRFARFAERAVDAFGEGVDLWCTLNEPNVVSAMGYIRGIWPPGKVDAAAGMVALANQLKAHARAARTCREKTHRPVGIAHHVRLFTPLRRNNLVDRALAAVTDDLMNQAIIDAAITGRIQIYVPGQVHIDEQVPDLAGSFDYLGLNYYSRDHIQADFKDPSLSRQLVPPGRPVTDLGWDIYPQGLYLVLKRWSKLGLPIYVTENGIADQAGTRRGDFLRAHLAAVQRASREGADVRGYFHWSLIDNFEWAEGFEPRFGLYRVDYGSPEKTRTPTGGVPAFQEIARALKLSPTAAGATGAAASRS